MKKEIFLLASYYNMQDTLLLLKKSLHHGKLGDKKNKILKYCIGNSIIELTKKMEKKPMLYIKDTRTKIKVNNL